jgi:hypothetical protein
MIIEKPMYAQGQLHPRTEIHSSTDHASNREEEEEFEHPSHNHDFFGGGSFGFDDWFNDASTIASADDFAQFRLRDGPFFSQLNIREDACCLDKIDFVNHWLLHCLGKSRRELSRLLEMQSLVMQFQEMRYTPARLHQAVLALWYHDGTLNNFILAQDLHLSLPSSHVESSVLVRSDSFLNTDLHLNLSRDFATFARRRRSI